MNRIQPDDAPLDANIALLTDVLDGAVRELSGERGLARVRELRTAAIAMREGKLEADASASSSSSRRSRPKSSATWRARSRSGSTWSTRPRSSTASDSCAATDATRRRRTPWPTRSSRWLPRA